MAPTHGGFDLRRDHGFRNPPVLPFRIPGAPGAWQHQTAPPPPRSNRHENPQLATTGAFDFRRAPAPSRPPDAPYHLRHPYHQQPQPWVEGRGAGDDTNAPPRNITTGRNGSAGGDIPPRDNGGGVGGETKRPPFAPLSPPRSSAVLDAAPASDHHVQAGGGQAEGGERAEVGRRKASVAGDAHHQPAEATAIAASADTIAAAVIDDDAASEGRSPRCLGQVHPVGYDTDSPRAAIALSVGAEAACPGTGAGGWEEEVVLPQRETFEADVRGMVEVQDEDEDEEGWAMSKEWQEHLKKSPSVQRYLQRMQAKPSTWKDWRGGKKGNKKKSGKNNAAGGSAGAGSSSSSNSNGNSVSNSVGTAADNNAEKRVSKGGKTDKTSPSSSSKQQQQQQHKKKKNSGEKKADMKKPSASKRGKTASAPPVAATSPRTAAKQALELELAKIEAHALLYAQQQEHRPLENAVIISSQLNLF